MPSGLFPSELIWNYGYYKQLAGLLERGFSLSQGRQEAIIPDKMK
jgi:hypothetical protein